MLRITKTIEDDQTVTLRLDGKLTEANIADLEQHCSGNELNGKRVVVLDLLGVTYIDDVAAKRVARLKSNRIRIVNSSLFIEAVLNDMEK